MALKEVYTNSSTIAMFEVDPASTYAIIEGMAVGLSYGTTAGEVAVVTPATTANNGNVIGIAGDSYYGPNSTSTPDGNTEYRSRVLMGTNYDNNTAWNTRATTNNIGDFFNETSASGKITVYMGGGQFLTDQWTGTVASFTPGSPVYVDASNPGKLNMTVAGRRVGWVLHTPVTIPSGIPGTDVSGSTALTAGSTSGYLEFILDIG